MAETKDEIAAERDELREENERLRAQLDERDAGAGAAEKRRPQRPTDGDGNPILSAGERADLVAHGVTISPFNGEQLDAITEGIPQEEMTPEAIKRAERAKRDRERVPDGPAPHAHVGTADVATTTK